MTSTYLTRPYSNIWVQLETMALDMARLLLVPPMSWQASLLIHRRTLPFYRGSPPLTVPLSSTRSGADARTASASRAARRGTA